MTTIDTSWSTGEWAETSPGLNVNADRLSSLVESGFGENSNPNLALNLALVVAHRGKIVAENYGPETDKDTTLISWSMAKSVVHAMLGCLVADGLIDPKQPPPIEEWADDERSTITIQHLLNMTSGLKWVEDYVDDQASDVIEMLFGSGQTDTAAYARALPLAAEPGTLFNYSSGTTNIVSRLCGDLIGGGVEGTLAYLSERILEPAGMTSAVPKFDDAGTFIGSSFLYATARDFARFGSLYLNEGLIDGRQIIPAGWAEAARTSISVETGDPFGYGAHWWLWDERTNAYAAHGYEGQYIIVVPERDLVVTRLGKTPRSEKEDVTDWLAEIVGCFPVTGQGNE